MKDFESHMVVRICKLGNTCQGTASRYLMVKENAGCSILTLELEAKRVKFVRHGIHRCDVVLKDILKQLTA